MESTITYFEKPGVANTDMTLRLARERANVLGIRQILVASTYGDTALKAMDVFQGFKVVVVGTSPGPRASDHEEILEQRFSSQVRQAVEAKGGIVLISTHVFGGITRAYHQLEWRANPTSLIAATLRAFGTGMKVACEITMMASDAGLANTTEDAVAIAGRGRGADTAIVLRPVNSPRLFDLRVKEIICKPRQD